MRSKKSILFIILIFYSCQSPNEQYWIVNEKEINSIDDVTEDVINEFYRVALDTIVKDNFLYPMPQYVQLINDTSYEFSEAPIGDQLFFNEQIKKFESFKWDSTKIDVRLFPEDYDSLIKEDVSTGWSKFRKNHKGYVHYITLPLFSRDFKKVYVEYGEQWQWLDAQGYLYIFELQGDKWVLKKKMKTWES